MISRTTRRRAEIGSARYRRARTSRGPSPTGTLVRSPRRRPEKPTPTSGGSFALSATSTDLPARPREPPHGGAHVRTRYHRHARGARSRGSHVERPHPSLFGVRRRLEGAPDDAPEAARV